MSLLNCQNVSFSYEGKQVLEDVDFSINQGDYLCIVGENGAGKSTLIRGILNLKQPSSGKIITDDGLKSSEIGYLPQQTQAQKDFPASVYEVVVSGRLNSLKSRLFYNKEDIKEAFEKMEMLGIFNLRNKCYRELSGGQQQRVLLARAMCATKKMILLDEPITGLDPIMSKEFYEIIKRLNIEENITVIMVSHDVKGAIDYATHVLHISGQQLFFGSVEDYKKSSLGSDFLSGGVHNV